MMIIFLNMTAAYMFVIGCLPSTATEGPTPFAWIFGFGALGLTIAFYVAMRGAATGQRFKENVSRPAFVKTPEQLKEFNDEMKQIHQQDAQLERGPHLHEVNRYFSQLHHNFIVKFCRPLSVSAILATAIGIVSVELVRHSRHETAKMNLLESALVLAYWTMAPPGYLFVEYAWFRHKLSAEENEHLRHFQELTRNVWIATVALLAALCVRSVPGIGG